MRIRTFPDEILKTPTEKVESFTPELRDTAIRMYKLMLVEKGAGLAAPQVGVSLSFFVVEKTLMPHMIIANPTWKPAGDAKTYVAEEGCLSFPGLWVEIPRYDKIEVEYQCVDGKMHKATLDGFAAHVFQHEEEHTRGVLMIDHLGK